MSYHVGDQPIPGYKLEAFLGQGSYGSVWKAVGPGGVPCAMKFISLDSKSGLKEMKAIGLIKKLQHPNLCPVQAIWLKDKEGNLMSDNPTASESTRFMLGGNKELIIAMGLGQKTLAQRLEECRGRGGIPIRDLIRYMEDAAKGIDYLNDPVHDLGGGPSAVIHCDIKPANLLIVGGGVQVCDYGVARAISPSGDSRKTFAAGTPAYAPAELINNEPCSKTDQYSLAITYFELRTGHLPFDEAKAIIANLTGQLDLSDLPADERSVLEQATALQPARRFETCLEMVEALKMASGVTVSTMSRRGGPSASGFQLPDYPSLGTPPGGQSARSQQPPSSGYPHGSPAGTPSHPGDDPRFNPPGTPPPRGTDQVRFTPEPPDSYAGLEGVWPPSGPLKPPSSRHDASGQPGSGRPSRPTTPPYGTPAAYPAPQGPIPLQPVDGTIQFDGPMPPQTPMRPIVHSGFAEDPSSVRPVGPRPKGDHVSNELNKKLQEAQQRPQQKPNSGSSGTGMLLALAACLLLLLVGGGAGVYFLVIKPKNEAIAAATSSAASTEISGKTVPTLSPATSTPPTELSPIEKLKSEVAKLIDAGKYQDATAKITELRGLSISGAGTEADRLLEKLKDQQIKVEHKTKLAALDKAIEDKDQVAASDQLKALEKHMSREMQAAYRGKVAALPRPIDPIQQARQMFANRRIPEGLKLLADQSHKFSETQRQAAMSLTKVWGEAQKLNSSTPSTVQGLLEHGKNCDKLGALASAEDKADVETFAKSIRWKGLTELAIKLDSVSKEDWETLQNLGMSRDAPPVAQSLALEAALELNRLGLANPPGLTKPPMSQTDEQLPNFNNYLTGLRSARDATSSISVVESWAKAINGELPNWVTQRRATRMVEVVKKALEGADPKENQANYAKWKPFVMTISTQARMEVPPPSAGLDLASLQKFFGPLKEPATAKLADYRLLYTNNLKPLTLMPSDKLLQGLKPEQKTEASGLVMLIGQHLLVNSVAWNAVSELRSDKTNAAELATKMFELSDRIEPDTDKRIWRGIAQMLQPITEKAAPQVDPVVLTNSSDKLAAKFLKLLAEAKGISYSGDRKNIILELRKNVDGLGTLIGQQPNSDLDRLIRKFAILQSLHLVQVDRSSWFRQELRLQAAKKWLTGIKAESPDEIFLHARMSEAIANILLPEGRFTDEKPGSYKYAIDMYSKCDTMLEQQSPEISVAFSRTSLLQHLDRRDNRGVPYLPNRADQITTSLKNSIKLAEHFGDLAIIAEANKYLGQAALVEGDIKKDQNGEAAVSCYELARSAFNKHLSICSRTPWQEKYYDTTVQYFDALEKAWQTSSRLAAENTEQKRVNALSEIARIERMRDSWGIKAYNSLLKYRLEKKEYNLDKIDHQTILAAIKELLSHVKQPSDLTTQDAEMLAELYMISGWRIKRDINVNNITTQRELEGVRSAYGKLVDQLLPAYQLVDSHTLMSGDIKSRICYAYGSNKFSHMAYLKSNLPSKDVKEADPINKDQMRKLCLLAAEALDYAMLYNPTHFQYWATLAYSAEARFVSVTDLAREIKQRNDEDQDQVNYFFEQAMTYTEVLFSALESEVVAKNLGLIDNINMDLRLAAYQYEKSLYEKFTYPANQKLLFKYLTDRNFAVDKAQQSKSYDQWRYKLCKAELLLKIGQGDEKAEGKKLADEVIPLLRKELSEPLVDSDYDKLKALRRYQILRAIERINQMK